MNTLPELDPLVLLVEDELLIATSLEIMLETNGYRVLGPVATVKDAMALLENTRPDMALLDYRLASTTTEPLLPVLAQLGVPVCVLSGYSHQQLPVAYHECAMLNKPFGKSAMLAMLKAMEHRQIV